MVGRLALPAGPDLGRLASSSPGAAVASPATNSSRKMAKGSCIMGSADIAAVLVPLVVLKTVPRPAAVLLNAFEAVFCDVL